MDRIDRQIVALLREDARRSYQDIGSHVHLSAPAVKRRVDRLEASGVIRGYDAITGKLAWAWDIGHPDRSGAPPAGDTYTRGTPNMWTAAAGDEDERDPSNHSAAWVKANDSEVPRFRSPRNQRATLSARSHRS